MHAATGNRATTSRVGHVERLETERMIARGRVVALTLAAGLVASFGDERSVTIVVAVALLATTVAAVHLTLRRPRSHRTLAVTGWVGFLADAVVCATALAAVADDPIDPIGSIVMMVAIEAAVRWGTPGAVYGGLTAGAIAVGWAVAGYDAIGRDLPATSIAFRLLVPAVVALPAALLIGRLRRQQEHTRHLFESSRDAMVIVDRGRVVAANPVATELVGAPIDHLLDRPFSEHVGPLLQVGDLADLLDREGRPHRVDLTHLDGVGRWLAVGAETSEDAGLVFVTARDVTEQRIREEDLRFRAWHDQMTGLPNRAAMRTRLAERLDREPGTGLVVLDLDDFKEVNDTYGHVAGDELLRQVADRLRGLTRESDVAYRLAGDEFCIVVDAATPAVLATLAERIAQALERGFRIGPDDVHVHASVGTALAEAGDDEPTLLARADHQMYRSKQTRSAATLRTLTDEAS